MSDKRRPIQARETRWAHTIAQWLYKSGLRPNSISVASIFFAALAGAAIATSAQNLTGLIVGAVLIQFRLLCNLFDGMVAVEFGLKSKSGELFNDAPDRLADTFILIGVGYSLRTITWGSDLGWLAASLAVLTAYVRVLGVSAGSKTYFLGPMAKQHRMALVTLACLLAAAEKYFWHSEYSLITALLIVIFGSAITAARRLHRIYLELESKPD